MLDAIRSTHQKNISRSTMTPQINMVQQVNTIVFRCVVSEVDLKGVPSKFHQILFNQRKYPYRLGRNSCRQNCTPSQQEGILNIPVPSQSHTFPRLGRVQGDMSCSPNWGRLMIFARPHVQNRIRFTCLTSQSLKIVSCFPMDGAFPWRVGF